MSDPKTCVILVPSNFGIEAACERSLGKLEERGYPVWRVPGFSAIDQARNQLATDALAKGFEELFWLDGDTEFDPDAIETLRSHNLPVVSGIYPKKGQRALASRLLPGTKKIVFGQGGGVIEIMYAATGFLLTRRQVYDDIQRHCNLPVCNRQFNKAMVPYFMPLIVTTDEEPSRERPAENGTVPFGSTDSAKSAAADRQFWYLAEDFAFSHRAREAGYQIFADTTVRLGHIGRYSFSWEDAGGSNKRYATYNYHIV